MAFCIPVGSLEASQIFSAERQNGLTGVAPPRLQTSRDELGTLASSHPQTEVPRSSAPPIPRGTGTQMSQSAASTWDRSGCSVEAESPCESNGFVLHPSWPRGGFTYDLPSILNEQRRASVTDANQLARELRLRARCRSELRRSDSRSKRQNNTGEGVFKCCSNQPRCSDKPVVVGRGRWVLYRRFGKGRTWSSRCGRSKAKAFPVLGWRFRKTKSFCFLSYAAFPLKLAGRLVFFVVFFYAGRPANDLHLAPFPLT